MIDSCNDNCEFFEVHKDITDNVKSYMMKEEDAVKLSEVFKVLGDPTRIKILYVLSKYEMCVCDIAEVLEMTQSAISHQLRVLRTMRLVKFRKEGKSMFYSLDDEHILQLFNQGMEHIQHN
ncbi:MAG TPA: metalloregulator ArsR/SmtB family transcription factor [Clostridiales bacterium]|nr:metalloregulator ArsR/SmtB family transcription factor [Clostridiales bacterium]